MCHQATNEQSSHPLPITMGKQEHTNTQISMCTIEVRGYKSFSIDLQSKAPTTTPP